MNLGRHPDRDFFGALLSLWNLNGQIHIISSVWHKEIKYRVYSKIKKLLLYLKIGNSSYLSMIIFQNVSLNIKE
jgi:hypothetical protein